VDLGYLSKHAPKGKALFLLVRETDQRSAVEALVFECLQDAGLSGKKKAVKRYGLS
jgi:hypothetical protein